MKEIEYNICWLKGKVIIEKDKLNRFVFVCLVRKLVDDIFCNFEILIDCIEFVKLYMVLRFEIDEILLWWWNFNSIFFLKRVRIIVEDVIEKILNLF